MSSSIDRVTCKVPGSTSNCGSGFDTLGLALSIYNWVTVERVGSAKDSGEDGDIFPGSEMAQATANAFFERAEVSSFPIRVKIHGDVPRARGLGSSVTVRGGILAGLAKLCGLDWEKETLVEIITELEGHPDNASASVLGGFTVSRFLDNPAKVDSVARFPIEPALRFVVVSPEFEVLTSASRGVLPQALPFASVISSINSASCLVAAMASGEYEGLEGCVHDSVHEPYRLKSIPGGEDAIRAGIEAGAYTGWLSGSGSSVLCACCAEKVGTVAARMQAAFEKAGLASVAHDLEADNLGIVAEHCE